MEHINPDLFRTQNKRFDLYKWIGLAVIFSISLYISLMQMQNPSSDISIHATWASEMHLFQPRTILRHVFHPMWHIPVMLLYRAGLSLTLSAAFVTACFKALAYYLIHRLMSLYLSTSRAMTSAVAFACCIVSSIYVPVLNETIYLGGGSPNLWHSPTQMVCIPFMILSVCMVSTIYSRFEKLFETEREKANIPWHDCISMGIVLFLSLVAKPVFMQAFLPAACLFFLFQWIRHPKNSAFFLRVLACVGPSILFMLLQTVYYFDVPSQSTMAIGFTMARFMFMLRYLILMMLFPIWILLTSKSRFRKQTLVTLTVMYTASALLELVLLAETGYRASDGNFGWACLAAAMMLWIVTMILFTDDTIESISAKGSLSFRHISGIVLLLWHFFSGVYYIIYLISGNLNC